LIVSSSLIGGATCQFKNHKNKKEVAYINEAIDRRHVLKVIPKQINQSAENARERVNDKTDSQGDKETLAGGCGNPFQFHDRSPLFLASMAANSRNLHAAEKARRAITSSSLSLFLTCGLANKARKQS
jgi:hypothetical protein